ncbi:MULTISPECIES: TorD/DmsD family molecular chaperone [Shewanella]|uniref:Molecular chaperone TorD family protein n=1 Tax=Shewanella metallivivens TaxID=2872342 RepID=A0ABT5TK90_9GAMM|nr:molecular chaperone TorD family protein [Shewanella metallivivens]MDD8059023.1 molecular chaperone TorD family protein [Shewanella metallivivens]
MSQSTQMNMQEFQSLARILHNVLFYDPTTELLENLIKYQVIESWPMFSGSQAEAQAKTQIQAYLQTWNNEQTLALKLDYGQLFYGPAEPSAVPWGSVYLSEKQLLNGESTQELMVFYQQQGVSFELDSNQPVDHIGLFFAVLDQMFAQLAIDENETLRSTLIILLQQHLLPWSARCLSLVQQHAQTDFYRGFAIFAQAYLDEVCRELQIVPLATQLYR